MPEPWRVLIPGFKCLRCNHQWVQRGEEEGREKPRICPACKSAYWDLPRAQKKGGGVAK